MKHLQRLAFLSFILLMSCTTLLKAQDQDTDAPAQWTPARSMSYHNIQGTALSPDGSLVAYVVREPVMEGEKSEYLSHIYLASTDGAWNSRYTRGDESCTSPSFSPDGSYLAFLTSRSGETQIWTMPVRGGEGRQLTEAKTDVEAFQWSPDGTRIAYTMRDPETEEEEEAKKEKRDVILVDKNFKYNHLYTITVDEEGTDADSVLRLTQGALNISSFDWSPDGQTIAFAHASDPTINTAFVDHDISAVPADSGSVTPLVSRPGNDLNPMYAPDGSRIAFTSHGGSVERIGLSDVWVIPAGGGEARKMVETPDRSATLLDWAGDGQSVYVDEAVGTTRQVLAVPAAPLERPDAGLLADLANVPQPVTSGEGVFGSVTFNRDASRMAFTFQKAETPADVFVASVNAFSMEKLTDLHADLEALPMGRTERVTWTSADGMEVEGLLTYPIGYEAGRTHPLILQIHGGPAGVFFQGFTGGPGIYMTQVFAHHGYAVLRPNPRGSSGYGKDFRYANVMDWGYGDYEDVMSGVDKVIEMGVGHPDSLAVMGWSYGGYLTSFLVTRTDRFRAASVGAGLPNLISMVTTTDIPDYLASHMGGEYWDDYETYEKHSAMYRIKEVTTPTQVIHGQNDLRVPFTQGQEFYVALKRRGIPTEMIVYPRTPHGPREPKFLMDVTPRILTWFDHHLGRHPIESEVSE